jgi:hypothetical protein
MTAAEEKKLREICDRITDALRELEDVGRVQATESQAMKLAVVRCPACAAVGVQKNSMDWSCNNPGCRVQLFEEGEA